MKATKDVVDLYANKFDCVPEKDLRISGDWNSNSGKSLYAVFNKCSGSDDCKSEEEIEEFLRGAYVMVLYNQIRFDGSRFHEDAILPESRVKWMPISYSQP